MYFRRFDLYNSWSILMAIQTENISIHWIFVPLRDRIFDLFGFRNDLFRLTFLYWI